MDNIEKFDRIKENLLRNRENALQRVKKEKEKYKKIEMDGTIDKKESRLELAKKIIRIREHALELIDNELEFLRPSSQEGYKL